MSAVLENDPRPLFLNEWAAAGSGAKIGDTVTLDYYLWSDEDGLETSSSEFQLAGIVPMDGIGGDQTLTPEYPGISDAADMTSWDPPFPVDLKRVRPKDEDYWDRYRAAPKAIISLADGQRIWGSRYGKVSSLRLSGTRNRQRAGHRSGRRRVSAPVTSARRRPPPRKAPPTSASTSSTSASSSSSRRCCSRISSSPSAWSSGRREIGLLSAVGFSPGAIRRSFLSEGAVLAGIGAVIGTVAAVGYGAAIMYGLRTWWVGAVGTTELTLHVAPAVAGHRRRRRARGRDPRHLARRSRHDAGGRRDRC